MNEVQEDPRTPTETDGFAWASLIVGSISLFYADRAIYPNPRGYFVLTLVLPATGFLTAFIADRRIRQRPSRGGREFAIAGAVLSGITATMLLLTKVFVD